MAAATPTLTPANRSIFVHYHFHETASRPCEASRKRTSLELFLQRAVLPSPPSVLFLFTLSGHALPPPAAYFESIALPRDKRAEIFPSRANVLVQTVPPSTTDLCHRALAIRTARSRSLRRGAPTPEFGLFLNDGARGPFLHPDSPTLGAALGVPPWLARYVGAFTEGGGAGGSGSGGSARIGAVGACFSCQIDSHLQSWAMMVDWRLSALLLERYSKTCARRVGPGRLPDAAKREAVVEGEVRPIAHILSLGYAITSFFPRRLTVTNEQRLEMQVGMRNSGCTNAFNSPASFHSIGFGTLGEMTFAKAGGEQWRRGLMPPSYSRRLDAATARLLPEMGRANGDCIDDLKYVCCPGATRRQCGGSSGGAAWAGPFSCPKDSSCVAASDCKTEGGVRRNGSAGIATM